MNVPTREERRESRRLAAERGEMPHLSHETRLASHWSGARRIDMQMARMVDRAAFCAWMESISGPWVEPKGGAR